MGRFDLAAEEVNGLDLAAEERRGLDLGGGVIKPVLGTDELSLEDTDVRGTDLVVEVRGLDLGNDEASFCSNTWNILDFNAVGG